MVPLQKSHAFCELPVYFILLKSSIFAHLFPPPLPSSFIYAHTHTHALSLSLSLSLSFLHTHALSLSLSHTHTLSLSFSLSFFLYSLSLFGCRDDELGDSSEDDGSVPSTVADSNGQSTVVPHTPEDPMRGDACISEGEVGRGEVERQHEVENSGSGTVVDTRHSNSVDNSNGECTTAATARPPANASESRIEEKRKEGEKEAEKKEITPEPLDLSSFESIEVCLPCSVCAYAAYVFCIYLSFLVYLGRAHPPLLLLPPVLFLLAGAGGTRPRPTQERPSGCQGEMRWNSTAAGRAPVCSESQGQKMKLQQVEMPIYETVFCIKLMFVWITWSCCK